LHREVPEKNKQRAPKIEEEIFVRPPSNVGPRQR
jgi:hypothetical protein